MSKALSPLQSWLLLFGTGAVSALLVLADQLVAAIALVVAVIMALVVRLLWQASTEEPAESERVNMNDEPPRCCICNAEYDPSKPYGSLNVHLEQLDKRGWIDTLDAAQIGACCQPSCFRELWDRLRTAFPDANFEHTEESVEVFTRRKG